MVDFDSLVDWHITHCQGPRVVLEQAISGTGSPLQSGQACGQATGTQ